MSLSASRVQGGALSTRRTIRGMCMALPALVKDQQGAVGRWLRMVAFNRPPATKPHPTTGMSSHKR